MIRVLVAEDSVTTRDLLVSILSEDPDVVVVGEANNGLEAVEMTKQLRPDVITMDIQMPRMNGLEATKRIMVEAPTPIVIVSASVDGQQVEISMNALRAGAVALLPKPSGPTNGNFGPESRQFLSTIKSMSQVKVVRHWEERFPVERQPRKLTRRAVAIRIVAIAASTGGPAALQRVIRDLPGNLTVPVVVVQHIASGFVGGMASWLNAGCSLAVKVAEQGEPLLPATVYIAPDDRHLAVDAHARVTLSSGAPVGGFRPSASVLFQSVARQFGASSVAVILTGMGEDGVRGLQAVRDSGGTIIAQDEPTSVVFGMPAAAIAAGLPDLVLPLCSIATHIQEMFAQEEQRT